VAARPHWDPRGGGTPSLIAVTTPRHSRGEALARALDTWPTAQILIPPLSYTSDPIDPLAFEVFVRLVDPGRDFDVMLEAKTKDLALLELRKQILARSA
jgi:hypothetical protein